MKSYTAVFEKLCLCVYTVSGIGGHHIHVERQSTPCPVRNNVLHHSLYLFQTVTNFQNFFTKGLGKNLS